MPYIQRDFSGKIVGVYSCPQQLQEGSCLTETELVADDHPELIEFKNNSPALAHVNMTAAECQRDSEDQKRTEQEILELQHLVLQHIQAWTELETALSALLYAALNIQPSSSLIAYAIYHSLTGFDARLNVVNNVIIQLLDENSELELLREHWPKLNTKIDAAKKGRNTVAHSTIQKLHYGTKPGKLRAVLSPLPFDVIRLQRKISEGKDPGLNVSQVQMLVNKAFKLAECIDSVNRVISNFHQFGKDTLPQTIPAVEARLKELCNL